jgi:hypothetical protein
VVRELVAAGLKGEVLVAEVMRLTGLPTSDVHTLIWIEMKRPLLPGTTLEEIASRAAWPFQSVSRSATLPDQADLA